MSSLSSRSYIYIYWLRFASELAPFARVIAFLFILCRAPATNAFFALCVVALFARGSPEGMRPRENASRLIFFLFALQNVVRARHLSSNASLDHATIPASLGDGRSITQSAINLQSIVPTASSPVREVNSGSQIDVTAEKCKLNNTACATGTRSIAPGAPFSPTNGVHIHERATFKFNSRRRRDTRRVAVGSNVETIADEKSTSPESANGLSGLNALLRAMQAKNLNASQVAFTEKYLELAVFLSDSAYRLLNVKLQLDDRRIIKLILGFINQIQAVFYQPSLNGRLHITIVYIELQKSPKFNTFGGDRDQLLNAFCDYQAALNARTDSKIRHWDMALYLTAENMFAADSGTRNYVSMGLVTVTLGNSELITCVSTGTGRGRVSLEQQLRNC